MYSTGCRRSFRFALGAVALLTIAGSLVSSAPDSGAAVGGRAVMLVVDTSGSMTGTRLEQAKAALEAGVDALPAQDVAGIHQYGGSCGDGGTVLVPPGVNNRDALRSAVAGL